LLFSYKNFYFLIILTNYKGVDIILEYIPKGSLRNVLNEYGKLSENMTCIFAKDIVLGLIYLHEN
jgi:serine/threonine protein kinase